VTGPDRGGASRTTSPARAEQAPGPWARRRPADACRHAAHSSGRRPGPTVRSRRRARRGGDSVGGSMPATYARPPPWLTVDHPVPPPPTRFTGLDHEQHGDVCPANRAGEPIRMNVDSVGVRSKERNPKTELSGQISFCCNSQPSSALLLGQKTRRCPDQPSPSPMTIAFRSQEVMLDQTSACLDSRDPSSHPPVRAERRFPSAD
jgi:hypothetical protein